MTGNPLNDSSWGDLPKIAVSNEEIFITINLYINNTNWNQAVVYQVSKRDAYNGKSPKYKVWSNFMGKPFTLTALGWGQQGNYGPGIYLICSGASASGGSNLLFYQITDTLNASGAKVNYYNIPVANFSAPTNATQMGTTWPIGTADCRSKSGFYLNGVAHFVFTSNYSGGYSGINYARLDVITTKLTMKTYGASGIHYGFPAIASFGSTINDQSVIIGCNYVDKNSFPGIKALFCDNAMNFGSTPIDVKTGDSYVKYPTSSSPERWGDYSGAWRKCNSSSVWLAGMYGRADHYWGQWLAEIKDISTSTNDLTDNSIIKSSVYPNPAVQLFKMDVTIKKDEEIEISINDIQGRIIKELYKGIALKGENVFTFNKNNLAPGVYFIIVKGNNKLFKTEKLVIEDN